MKCPYCNNENPEGSTICNNCGYALTNTNPLPSNTEGVSQTNNGVLSPTPVPPVAPVVPQEPVAPVEPVAQPEVVSPLTQPPVPPVPPVAPVVPQEPVAPVEPMAQPGIVPQPQPVQPQVGTPNVGMPAPGITPATPAPVPPVDPMVQPTMPQMPAQPVVNPAAPTPGIVEGPKPKKKNNLILIILILLVIGCGGAFVYFTVIAPNGTATNINTTNKEDKKEDDKKTEEGKDKDKENDESTKPSTDTPSDGATITMTGIEITIPRSYTELKDESGEIDEIMEGLEARAFYKENGSDRCMVSITSMPFNPEYYYIETPGDMKYYFTQLKMYEENEITRKTIGGIESEIFDDYAEDDYKSVGTITSTKAFEINFFGKTCSSEADSIINTIVFK